jgi:hypothetical protein
MEGKEMIITVRGIYKEGANKKAALDHQSAAAIRDLGVLMAIIKREIGGDDEEGTRNEAPQGKCPQLSMLLEAYTHEQIRNLVGKLPPILSVVFIGRSVQGDRHMLILGDKPSMTIFAMTLKTSVGVDGLVRFFRHNPNGTRITKTREDFQQLYLDESFVWSSMTQNI